ncbi:stage II sporulation protein P [Psychrobacillus sp. FSL H8-0483]|uniref:stage II sporulation protein P n=1 Tax=Psychrobacillus sp. FSL H8-0483 TaxID=2921389 RepID=UPI00315A53FB
MPNKARILIGLILLLFISPIMIATFSSKPQQVVIAEPIEDKQVVYASATQNEIPNSIELMESKKALLLFTHSHEAFLPIVQSENGQTAVYHSTSNITAFEDIIRNQFSLNSIETEFLAVDTMAEMKKTNRTFSQAYSVVRPFLTAQIQENKYDIIIDLHRDAATRDKSTLTYNNETFGKIYFVVGEDYPNFALNKSFAQQLSANLNELVPGISRGVIGKKGDNVNGIYNQDLANNMVLIELGGIDNTQEEINRTISVLAKAISSVLQEQSAQNTNLTDVGA